MAATPLTETIREFRCFCSVERAKRLAISDPVAGVPPSYKVAHRWSVSRFRRLELCPESNWFVRLSSHYISQELVKW